MVRRIGSIASLWVLFLLVGCAAQQPTVGAAPEPVPEQFARYGWMPTSDVQVRALDGNTLLIRGRMQNPYDEPVVGVRLYVLLQTSGEPPRELERSSREVDTQVEPGGQAALRIELPTVHARGIGGMAVHAFALRRGTQSIQPPPELELPKGSPTITIAPSIPYPSTPVSTGFTGVSF